jgi:hypothetical protein
MRLIDKKKTKMEDTSEEDSNDDITLVAVKSDPNERIDNANEYETDEVEDVQDITSEESLEEQIFAVRNENDIKTFRKAMKLFERKHMLTVSELKMRKGFYDVPYICESDESVIQSNHQNNSECCLICMKQFSEGDEVAVNPACDKPHCLHIDCYFQFIRRIAIRDRSCAAGPNLLMKLKGCPKCPDRYCPVWCEWKYSYIVTRSWKNGDKLPNKDVKVYGIHHYDDGNIKFSHYITNYKLFISIRHYICALMRNQYVGTPYDLQKKFYEYNGYILFMKGTFTCKECKTQMYMWKAVYLRECNDICKYRICRDCFIRYVLIKNHDDISQRMDGILPCPLLCKKSSKAQFMLTNEPCSHKHRQMLLTWDVDG